METRLLAAYICEATQWLYNYVPIIRICPLVGLAMYIVITDTVQFVCR